MRNECMTPVPVKRAAEKHMREKRTFQGIPGIAVTNKGRVFVLFYSGGNHEGPDNFVVIIKSDDKGETWSDAIHVIDPPDPHVRAFDSTPWISPDGKLWIFWAQGYSEKEGKIYDGRVGVWAAVLENPDDDVDAFRWSDPRRICDGIMMNKPVILSNGTWALPVSVWQSRGDPVHELFYDQSKVGTKMVVSCDKGATFVERGKFVIPKEIACFDEHTILELGDGRLRIVARVNYGNLQSDSFDRGFTWTEPEYSKIQGPNSRLFLGRLKSGKLLLVNNDYQPPATNAPAWGERSKMTAWLSDDDGQTWYGNLLLDGRTEVSYPDVQQARDGSLWIVHDFARYRGGFLLVSHVTEEEIASGRISHPKSWISRCVSHTKGV